MNINNRPLFSAGGFVIYTMKKNVFTQAICFLFLYLLSCNNPVQQAAPVTDTAAVPATASVIKPPATAFELDEKLAAIDSMVFVFYKDPYTKDSLRYSRFYTQYSTTDSAALQVLISNSKDSFVKYEIPKPCRNEGKVWCYGKGKILQTMYFSERCPDCCHIYLIKDGFFYYMPLQPKLQQLLKQLKPKAKEIKG
jgi:hypothetical protein